MILVRCRTILHWYDTGLFELEVNMDNKELEFELLTNKEDKRNKLITLTPKGKAYASEIIEALHKRELFAIDRMGLENVTRMNDYTELFNNLFQNREEQNCC